MEIVLGTSNSHKVRELLDLLISTRIAFRSLADFTGVAPAAEDGSTFAENARLKAVHYSRVIGRWVLAEDSGLEVDALGGKPGVHSARYSGPQADDERNNRRLLEELGTIPLEKRTARYVCHAALADPTGVVRAESEDACRGRIRFAASGRGGFGYDPLFEIVEYHLTFGELAPAVKACLSHRARAIRAMIPDLERCVKPRPV